MPPPSPRETRATCPYCGVGCGLVIEHDAQRIVGVRGDPDHPANFGRLCSKGATLARTTLAQGRALVPQLRAAKDAPRRAVSWNDALATAAARFAETIRAHGPDSVAFYLSGQLLTEDYYVFNKLARALVGTNNIDSNSRLCMSSAVAGYKATLGMDSVPCCYEDIELADLFFICGANPAFAHPIVFRRIEAARAARPATKLIVVDPRRTDTAAMADLHLQIAPGSDLYLYTAMLHVMVRERLIDEAYIAAHTEGFAALRAHVEALSPAVAAGVCGVDAEAIARAARWFAQAGAPLSLWCQGLNQSAHGSDNATALIQLHLATGTLGRPGMGPFSLTGQPNAMGGREVGAMANLLGAHRNLKSDEDRAEMAAFWGVPSLSERRGLMAVELFEAMHDGRVKALWIACTNPAHSLPDQTRVREALGACPFVVVQDAYADTDTGAYADLLLPAATWGEKDGTVTNSERRISRVHAAVAAPGEARADWRIARDFALALGRSLGRRDAPALFAYASPAEIFAEHARSTAGRDLDICALDYARLDVGPVQWPYRAQRGHGDARLYTDAVFATPNGRARFSVPQLRLCAEAPDAEYPLRLNSGRLRDQWHGMSRSGRLAQLCAHAPEARLHVHPDDLAGYAVRDGDLVELVSRRGRAVLPVSSDASLAAGGVYLAMHWGSSNGSSAGANLHTLGAVDPVSGQPELKHAAVRIRPVELPWHAVMLRACPGLDERQASERLLAWRQRLAGWLPAQPYASLTLAGNAQPLLVLRLARATPLGQDDIERLAEAVDMPAGACRRLIDRKGVIDKRALIETVDGAPRLAGLLLAGETRAAAWLLGHMADGLDVSEQLPWLLMPSARSPAGQAPRGRIVCSCTGVDENAIRTQIDAGADVPQLQAQLKCGTVCGSCVPELQRLFVGAI
jgi:assimilatory nitrate reductase catalytic subunit